MVWIKDKAYDSLVRLVRFATHENLFPIRGVMGSLRTRCASLFALVPHTLAHPQGAGA